MNDRRAVGPLIDALVTRHKHVIQPSQNNVSSTFGSGGGGFSYGSAPPKIINVPYQNEDVLEALVQLAGGPNYNFDVSSWIAWLATQKKAQSLSARRD